MTRSLAWRTAQTVLRRWPLSRGHHRVEKLLIDHMLGGLPPRGDVEFLFGTFIDVSLDAWPCGYKDLWTRGYLEKWETLAWLAILEKGDLVVDGGANFGYWSLLAAQVVGSRGGVIAVEAVPQTASALRRNLDASGVKSVHIVEYALADAAGVTTINLFSQDPVAGRSSIGIPEGHLAVSSVDVAQKRLDDILKPYSRSPKLIKLDIEGSELSALKGAAETIRSPQAPVICFEWNVITARSMGWHPRDAAALLAGLGYGAYLAGPAGLTPFEEQLIPEDWSPMIWAIQAQAQVNRIDAALKAARKQVYPTLLTRYRQRRGPGADF